VRFDLQKEREREREIERDFKLRVESAVVVLHSNLKGLQPQVQGVRVESELGCGLALIVLQVKGHVMSQTDSRHGVGSGSSSDSSFGGTESVLA
jgi:hypothetical protein